MATYVPAKRATELIFYLGLVSQSTGQFQTNPTLAAGDCKISKDGGALANLTTLPAVTPAGSKMVKVTVSSTEMTADNVTIVFSDAAGAEWDEVIVNIQTSANQIDDLATSAALANVQADTDNIQTRLPAALSGDGFMKADLKSIEDELTSGNNAVLNLKQLNIVNSTGTALVAKSTGGDGYGAEFIGDGEGYGMMAAGEFPGGTGGGLLLRGGQIGGNGLEVLSNTSDGASISGAAGFAGIFAYGGSFGIEANGNIGISAEGDNGDAIYAVSLGGNGDGIHAVGTGTGKSINAPNDIAVSDGDLTLTNIAKKVLTLDWTTVTGEAARSVLNALRKLRNKVSFNGTTTLTVYKEDGTTSAYTQTVTTDDTQDPFKELSN